MRLSKAGQLIALVTGFIIVLLPMNTAAASPRPAVDPAEVEMLLDTVIGEQMAEFNVPNAVVSFVSGRRGDRGRGVWIRGCEQTDYCGSAENAIPGWVDFKAVHLDSSDAALGTQEAGSACRSDRIPEFPDSRQA